MRAAHHGDAAPIDKRQRAHIGQRGFGIVGARAGRNAGRRRIGAYTVAVARVVKLSGQLVT